MTRGDGREKMEDRIKLAQRINPPLKQREGSRPATYMCVRNMFEESSRCAQAILQAAWAQAWAKALCRAASVVLGGCLGLPANPNPNANATRPLSPARYLLDHRDLSRPASTKRWIAVASLRRDASTMELPTRQQRSSRRHRSPTDGRLSSLQARGHCWGWRRSVEKGPGPLDICMHGILHHRLCQI